MAYSFFGQPSTTQLQQIDPWAIPEGGDMLGPDDGTGSGGYGSIGFDEQQLPPPDGGMQYPGGSASFDEGFGTYTPGAVDTRATSGGSAPASGGGGADPNSDPFAAMGGGVFVNGGWVPKDHPLAQQAGATAPSGTATAGAGVNAPVNGGPSIQQAYSSALQKILTGGNVQKPGQSDAMNAYRAEAGRGEARDRAFLAERAAADGTSASGAFDSDILGLRQNRRRGEATFAGQEQQQLREAERGQLMQALALALSQGDNEAARAIQLELGRGQLDVSRYGIQSGRDTSLDQLGLGYAQLQNAKDSDALRYIFGG